MSKHGKKKQNVQKQQKPQSPAVAPQPVSKGIFDKIREIVKDAPKVSEGAEQPNTDDIQAAAEMLSGVEGKLSEEEKNTLSELTKELEIAVEDYRTAKDVADARTAEQDGRSHELDERKEELKDKEDSIVARENAVGDKESKIGGREIAVKDREDAVSLREAEVAEREAAADAGFVAREANWKKKTAQELEKEIEEFQKEKKTFRDERARLAGDREKCDQELADCEERKKAFAAERQELKEEFNERVGELRDKHEREKAQLEAGFEEEKQRKDNKIQELKGLLDGFEDVRSRLGGRSPEEINAIIDELKTENEKLKCDLQRVGSAEFQKNLKEKNDELTDQYERLIVEKNALTTERDSLREKIVDLEGLVKLNKTLKTHNEALEEAQKQLRAELDELTSKDEKKEIFAELRAIDERCSAPYADFTPSDDKSLKDFVEALGYQLTQYTPHLYYGRETLQLFVGGLAMSRLILLQGISGTGKTKLAQAFSAIVGDNFNGKETAKTREHRERCSCIVPVQAGWRDNQDLLGYYNAFEKKFYEKPFSKGVYAASTPMFENRLFFVILDEMNLSHPEQYFADFISAMEQANSTSDEFEVELLSGIPKEVMDDKNRWPKGLRGEKLVVPPNVWFVGTANHDETTMEFADKTYDRAHVMVMERNDGNPNYGKVSRGAAHWSASALRDKFEEAQAEGEGHAVAVWEKLEGLRDFLKTEFNVALGNRLERQTYDFVPVVCAAGGNETLALDHLVATKIVRRGKVTGLFGVQKESLEKLCSKVGEIGLDETSQTVRLLRQDIASKERGG